MPKPKVYVGHTAFLGSAVLSHVGAPPHIQQGDVAVCAYSKAEAARFLEMRGILGSTAAGSIRYMPESQSSTDIAAMTGAGFLAVPGDVYVWYHAVVGHPIAQVVARDEYVIVATWDRPAGDRWGRLVPVPVRADPE